MFNKFQIIYNAALRLITGCHSSKPIPHLHHEAKVMPVKNHTHMTGAQPLASALSPDTFPTKLSAPTPALGLRKIRSQRNIGTLWLLSSSTEYFHLKATKRRSRKSTPTLSGNQSNNWVLIPSWKIYRHLSTNWNANWNIINELCWRVSALATARFSNPISKGLANQRALCAPSVAIAAIPHTISSIVMRHQPTSQLSTVGPVPSMS